MNDGRRFGAAGMRRGARVSQAVAAAAAGTDPIEVATLTLALIRNTGITGDPVSAWADQNAPAQSLSQGSGPSQPGISGDGALEFDGVDDYMGDITLGDIVDLDGYTYWVVVSVDAAAPGGATPGIFCVPSGAGWGIFCQRITGVDYVRAAHIDAISTKVSPDIAVSLATLYAVRVRYDGANLYVRVNGSETSIAAGSLVSGAYNVRLGVGGSHFSPQMTVHDIYVYDSHLDLATRNSIDTWLVANRGVTL